LAEASQLENPITIDNIKRGCTNYAEFGKYMISYQRLKYNSDIRIHYKNKQLNAFQKFDHHASKELRDYIMSMLYNKHKNDIQHLNKVDQVYLIELLNSAHIDIGQWKHDVKNKDEILDVLLGEIRAGNKNKSQLTNFLNSQLKLRKITLNDYNKIIDSI